MQQDNDVRHVKRDAQVLREAIKDFKRSVEITRDVRFQANLRLAGRQRASAYIVSLLSLYVIALSLLPNILELKPFQQQILLACSIVLSVFVIFTSLIDGAQNFYHQGELLHQCARKLATIYHDLRSVDVDADADKARAELAALQTQYARALDDCPINHASVDYYHEKVEKPYLFPADYDGRWTPLIRFRFWVQAVFLGNSWVIPHIAALVVISLVVYVWVIRPASLGGMHP